MKLSTRLFGVNWIYYTDEEIKKINVNDYYPIVLTCKNCLNSVGAGIKRGILVKTIITEIKCKHCECKLEKI